jgi:hypothetical protein
MKTKSSPICLYAAVVIVAALPTSHLAQEPAKTSFPFYVRLTQQYQYPGTELVSTAGMIEQVVNEDRQLPFVHYWRN